MSEQDALARMQHRLDLVESELARYATSASHDLRTPLVAIVGFLELLRVRSGDDLDDTARDFLARAETAGHQLDQMLDGLTRLARVKLDLELATVPWRHIVDTAMSELGDDVLPWADAVMIADSLPSVTGDPHELARLVLALVDNALRHHEEPDAARVVIRATEGGGLVVEDDGPGIDDALLERYLEPFKTGARPGPTRGVGLPIAIRIAQAHMGSMTLSRSPMGGLRASVRLGG